MPISDNDLQVMEEWLDGELPEGQVEALRRRLSSEPDLAQAMQRIRDERQARSRLFTLLEPGDAEAETQIGQLRRAVRREDVWALRVRGLQKVASLAAAIVVVFMAGWISRERLQVGPTQRPTTVVRDTAPIRPNSNNSTVLAGLPRPQQNDSGHLQFVDAPMGIQPNGMTMTGFQEDKRFRVLRHDPTGKLFVVPMFDPRIDPRAPGQVGVFPPSLAPVPPVQPQNSPNPGRGMLIESVQPPQGR